MEVIELRGPSPYFVNRLVQRLPDTSMTHALANGGRDHFGWGIDRYLAADTFDALNQNTRATGNWGKKKAPTFPQWPRPKSRAQRKSDQSKPKSVADLYARFNRR